MNDRDTMKTYIIQTRYSKEYYCGKTFNIEKRMIEHQKEEKRKWFGFCNRKPFDLLYIINGDYERNIKSFGIEKFIIMFDREIRNHSIIKDNILHKGEVSLS